MSAPPPSGRAVLAGLFDAFARRDLDAIRAAMTDGVVWHTPGDNLLAGSYAGPDEVIAQLGRSGQLTGGTYAVDVIDVLEGDGHAAVLYDGSGTREGRTARLRILALYELDGGRISAVRNLPLDQAAFDAFWS